MRCPNCGAEANTAFCEYCGTEMPIERVETQSINADSVVVNNYYYGSDQASSQSSYNPYQQQQEPRVVYVMADAAALGVSPKSRLAALLLCLFLGVFGAHRFYLGRIGLGILYLLTFGLFGIGYLVDLILILVGSIKDSNGLPVKNWE